MERNVYIEREADIASHRERHRDRQTDTHTHTQRAQSVHTAATPVVSAQGPTVYIWTVAASVDRGWHPGCPLGASLSQAWFSSSCWAPGTEIDTQILRQRLMGRQGERNRERQADCPSAETG